MVDAQFRLNQLPTMVNFLGKNERQAAKAQAQQVKTLEESNDDSMEEIQDMPSLDYAMSESLDIVTLWLFALFCRVESCKHAYRLLI